MPSGTLLQGRVVLITGAASGIGAASARAAQSEGAILALADRNTDALHQIAEKLADGGPVSTHMVDVSDPNSTAAMVAETCKSHGALHGAHLFHRLFAGRARHPDNKAQLVGPRAQ